MEGGKDRKKEREKKKKNERGRLGLEISQKELQEFHAEKACVFVRKAPASNRKIYRNGILPDR